MDIRYCCDADDGVTAYYCKGHVDINEFMTSMRKEVDADAEILKGSPRHCHLRYQPDPSGQYPQVIAFSEPGRGAFKATWLEL